MLTSPDFIELLSTLAKHDARYMVVGGYAVMKYTEPRFTKDLDLLIAADPVNAANVYAALKEFGAPLTGLQPLDFTQPGHLYQMGRPPLRVDILMSIPGIDFETAWPHRERITLGGHEIPFISRQHLIQSKRAAARPQDLIDLKHLEADIPPPPAPRSPG